MIRGPVLIDTGPIVALLAETDQNYERCLEQIKDLPQRLVSCWPVITEAAYLLRNSQKGMTSLFSRIELGRIELIPLTADDVAGIRRVRDRFHDQGFDFADACLMHLAEREGIQHVFTLDRRHFGVFCTTAGEALTVLPDGA